MSTLVVEGLDELRRRFQQWPEKFSAVVRKTLETSLLKLEESVPEYPPEPVNSSYTRTGTLGRTLSAGAADNIHEVTQTGGYSEASFGTRLEYAQYVIGDSPAWMHKGRWWRLVDVLEKSKDDIEHLFQVAAEEMAAWLDGRGA